MRKAKEAWDRRGKAAAGMLMVGDGAFAALEPARHCMISFLVERPGLTRALGVAEVGVGLWLAVRRRP